MIAAKLCLNAHIKSYITGEVRCKNKHKSTITVNSGVQVEKKNFLNQEIDLCGGYKMQTFTNTWVEVDNVGFTICSNTHFIWHQNSHVIVHISIFSWWLDTPESPALWFEFAIIHS